MISHIVTRGETLGSIARKYLGNSLRYKELATFNNLPNPNLIQVGQVIRIPEAGDLAPIAVTAQKILPANPSPFDPLPGTFELDTIEGSASRDWIFVAVAAGLAYWGLSR